MPENRVYLAPCSLEEVEELWRRKPEEVSRINVDLCGTVVHVSERHEVAKGKVVVEVSVAEASSAMQLSLFGDTAEIWLLRSHCLEGPSSPVYLCLLHINAHQ